MVTIWWCQSCCLLELKLEKFDAASYEIPQSQSPLRYSLSLPQKVTLESRRERKPGLVFYFILFLLYAIDILLILINFYFGIFGFIHQFSG
ncbi:hypothetical protein M426DRAFT_88699 [Hypoxylon sp. CI-4A]|nr:hypothetical protein M426DRAFT_88699 [Hypoxylon sp. CI-4A]